MEIISREALWQKLQSLLVLPVDLDRNSSRKLYTNKDCDEAVGESDKEICTYFLRFFLKKIFNSISPFLGRPNLS